MITLNSNTQSPEVQSEKLRRRFVTPTLKLTGRNRFPIISIEILIF